MLGEGFQDLLVRDGSFELELGGQELIDDKAKAVDIGLGGDFSSVSNFRSQRPTVEVDLSCAVLTEI